MSRVKIDQRFVQGVTSSPDDAKIVRAAISLAHALGIEVVAEGVETEDQRQFLIAAGCQVAQGNYLGEPMPADRVAALPRNNIQFSAI
jgi:EAL domain-containing protein (putative c-di-GMP-specific phosphodiesterase class I)